MTFLNCLKKTNAVNFIIATLKTFCGQKFLAVFEMHISAYF